MVVRKRLLISFLTWRAPTTDMEFESLSWNKDSFSSCTTPALTPGPLSAAHSVDTNGNPVLGHISKGAHWAVSSYPAWMGLSEPIEVSSSPDLSPSVNTLGIEKSTKQRGKWTQKSSKGSATPFDVDHIAKTIDNIREVMGFQFDACLNVFELLMSQLDSRASRTSPRAALRSLHEDYIGGRRANYRKWYFASEMDTIDLELDSRNKCRSTEVNLETKENDLGNEDISLEEAEAIWVFRFGVATDQERLEDVILYLCCWTEANQLRFMPECLAFIVKCARDYYTRRRVASNSCNPDEGEKVAQVYYLDKIVTPLYECYRHHNFVQTEEGEWIRREGDHKNFIGYDDINQLFWFRKGLETIKIHDRNGSSTALVSLPRDMWYTALADVEWKTIFFKTYRESRSWLHIVTNFSRIWILHAATFWFYTSFNSPSLYTIGYNYMQPTPPRSFVRWTVMSFGGLIGPVVTFVALLGELSFIPRTYPGSKPILPRMLSVLVMFFALGTPAVCNLVFNDWSTSKDNFDLTPAVVLSGVLFALAVVYTIYFSFQPLNQIFGGVVMGTSRRETEKVKRKYLANRYFTASFPKLSRKDWVISWLMCFAIFAAKMVESYFFLTLSLRDPIRELDIMSLEDKCAGDAFLIGQFLCRSYPKIILVATILTDMALFFLDTYLWYVIFSTIISVSIAISGGTSIWTPWRNIYSRLSHRISSKLLVTNTQLRPRKLCISALRVIWVSIVESLYDGHLINREQANNLEQIDAATQEPSFFTMNEDGKSLKDGSAAFRRISFFAQSLSTPMQGVMAVNEMPSFTVMIPHYKEKIILSLREAINNDTDSKVTALDYLRQLYPDEWENFVATKQFSRNANSSKSNISQRSRLHDTDTMQRECFSRVGFSSWDPNDTNPTRLWSSERSQTLYRTVRGFYNYTHALNVLFHAEHYTNAEEISQARISHEGTELVRRKFRLLVAMQLYDKFTVEQLQDVETLFNEFPHMVVSFVEHEVETNNFFSCVIDNGCPLLENGKRKPRMRIKLSGNPILGDGKSDNQNSALIYYRGEYIQLIDANQDNYLEECLKIRNVLMEFETGSVKNSKKGSIRVTSDPEANVKTLGVQEDEEDEEETNPVAIVGAREYIFSENIGVLGDVAAGKEQTFGTLYARTLARIGGKLHYGHPDILNAIFMTTRGGVSKGQRGLHLNEDIYAGMTALLRGGRIKHSEYFQCGKGRDLGFVSILNFTAKIGAGMGEQMISREYFYMGTQLPFDRFTSFYYAHPGFHLNNVFIMLSLDMLLIVTLWFSSIASVSTICVRDSKASFTEPHRPAGCKNVLPLLDWTRRCVVSIFLVFFVSLCPLFFQEVNEKGFCRSVKRILKHFCSLSMLFEIFVCRIYARSFWDDLNIGGAKYVATGRGFATARISFYRLFSGYHSDIMTGLKAAGVLTYASMKLWHPSYLWFWVTTSSLCMCPFLYNPHQFAFIDFFNDYRRLLLWFFETVTPNENISEIYTWSIMMKNNRDKITGVKNRTKASDSTRPSFRNILISQLGTSLGTTILLGIPYIYVNTQKISRHQSQPSTSAILRICFVSLLPLIVNCGVTVAAFLVSILLRLVGINRLGNCVAAISRFIFLIVHILDWWILYILERQQFSSTLLGIMLIASFHNLVEKILSVAFLKRQRKAKETNDPWWTGDWAAAKLGWKCPLIMVEELFVKTTESLRFSYDFITCHFILIAQSPLVVVPFIDTLHSLFLLWLPPSVCADAARWVNIPKSQRSKKRAKIYALVFLVISGLLVVSLTLPFYLPSYAMSRVVDLIDTVIPWSVIK